MKKSTICIRNARTFSFGRSQYQSKSIQISQYSLICGLGSAKLFYDYPTLCHGKFLFIQIGKCALCISHCFHGVLCVFVGSNPVRILFRQNSSSDDDFTPRSINTKFFYRFLHRRHCCRHERGKSYERSMQFNSLFHNFLG